MPRQPRFILPGYPQHAIIRGNDRTPIFRAYSDYQFFLHCLEEACDKHECELHAYVLMTNHVHLLTTPQTKEGLGKAMQMIGRYYVQYFNRKYERTGTLWEGRYKASLIDSDLYLLTCYRYVELNPVRANMVSRPEDHHWSSYGHNAMGKNNQLIIPHARYEALGGNDASRQSAYRALFVQEIPEDLLQDIRESTNKAWLMGTRADSNNKVDLQLNRRCAPLPRGGDHRSREYRKLDENNRNNRV